MYNNNEIRIFNVIIGGKGRQGDEIQNKYQNYTRIKYKSEEWIIEKIYGRRIKVRQLYIWGSTKTFNLLNFKKLIKEKKINILELIGTPVILTCKQKFKFKEIVETYNTDVYRCNELTERIISLIEIGTTRKELEYMLRDTWIGGDERFNPLMDSIFQDNVNLKLHNNNYRK